MNDLKKFPKLRKDLKISKMVNHGRSHYVIKDNLKDSYFRFTDEEWEIIEMFNGDFTLDMIVSEFNKKYTNKEIDKETIEEYWSHLDEIHLLEKEQKEMNIMLVEKMKENRQMQLLSKKGSLLYRRFPIIDPDRFFDKIIPKIGFFWTKTSLFISLSLMLSACLIIIFNWPAFNQGIYQVFSFSEMSTAHLITLWVVIYTTIAFHEFGHGLTCKYYGGEVHEIGFLLLFFQPCLYCNVNDAWLFDKKWKQVMVTIAGGYVEFLIGSVFAIIWVLTNQNTYLNTISLQIMTICSVSTVLFNFNPLMKLDGYYLLSDLLAVPNLKEESAKYLKHFIANKVFRMPKENFQATSREKRIYLTYGICAFFWMFGLLTGLVGMAFGLLVNELYEFGVILTGFIAYKLFKSHVLDSLSFLKDFIIRNISFFKGPKFKLSSSIAVLFLLITLVIPIHYRIKGNCTLKAQKIYTIRPKVNGQVVKFHKKNGEKIKKGDLLVTLENRITHHDKNISLLEYQKSKKKLRKVLINEPQNKKQIIKEINYRKLSYLKREKETKALNVYFNNLNSSNTITSCENKDEILGTFIKKGDELCKVLDISKLKTQIEIDEQQISFLEEGQDVQFKLNAAPLKTFIGRINNILPSGKTDPKNPKRKIYTAEILISNPDKLRPGMEGVAKVYGLKVPIIKYIILKLTMALRLDLFY